MHPITAFPLPLLLTALPAVAQQSGGSFDMTWPDTSEKLNLSAPITFNWTYIENSEFTEMDITFIYQLAGQPDGQFITEVLMNRTVADGRGEVTWDATEIYEDAEAGGEKLMAGKNHFFEAKFHHESDSNFGMSTRSEKYELAEHPLVDSLGQVVKPLGGMVLLGLGVAGAGLL